MILFENFKNIESICRDHDIEDYTINSDGSIDVDGNVFLRGMNLTKLPIKFNKVEGNFNCSNNKLTSLDGSPKEVGGNFYCGRNQLTSLEGGPEKVGEHYYCNNNKLVSLNGCCISLSGDFNCSSNKLTTLEGGPEKVDYFDCSFNQIYSLEGWPEKIKYNFNYSNNPISNIISLFYNYKEFKRLLDDYNYLRGTRIIKARFEQACIETGIKMPTKIEGYVII